MSEVVQADFAQRTILAPAGGQCPKCGASVLLVDVKDVGPALVDFDVTPIVRINQKLFAKVLTGSLHERGHLPHLCKAVAPSNGNT